jgi:hypothetical protein
MRRRLPYVRCLLALCALSASAGGPLEIEVFEPNECHWGSCVCKCLVQEHLDAEKSGRSGGDQLDACRVVCQKKPLNACEQQCFMIHDFQAAYTARTSLIAECAGVCVETPAPTPSAFTYSCANPGKCVGYGQFTNRCGGRVQTSDHHADWKIHESGFGVSLYVNTDTCGLKNTPVYLTTLVAGHMQQNTLVAVSVSVYGMSKLGFWVIVTHPSIKAKELQSRAIISNWALTWLAVTGPSCGVTPWGATQWKASETSAAAIQVDVDTSGSQFDATPRYFTMLHGETEHWRMIGGHTVYRPTESGFRVILYSKLSAVETLALARKGYWGISWFGSTDAVSASASPRWHSQFGELPYADVNTSATAFVAEHQSFIVALDRGQDEQPVSTVGAATITTTHDGFVMYIRNLNHRKSLNSFWFKPLKTQLWKVNYIGWAPDNCEVSKWGHWSDCSKTCKMGTRHRMRTTLRYPDESLPHNCPLLIQHEDCNYGPCRTDAPTAAPTNPPTVAPTETPTSQEFENVGGNRCGDTGTGHLSKTAWKPYGTNGLQLTVDTSGCGFGRSMFSPVPQYISAVMGDKRHWQLQGTNSILSATTEHFTIIVVHPTMRSKMLVWAASKYKWDVSWVGASDKHSGSTKRGQSGWEKTKDKTTLSLFVPTTSGRFTTEHPRFFTALTSGKGSSSAHGTTGAHIICEPNRTGFRVFVRSQHEITPDAAEAAKWAISWIGSEGWSSGRSDLGWKRQGHMFGKAIYIDVNTQGSDFVSTPAYISSICADRCSYDKHLYLDAFSLFGGASIFDATAAGFRVYLEHEVHPSFAQQNKWRVNYLGVSGGIHETHASIALRHHIAPAARVSTTPAPDTQAPTTPAPDTQAPTAPAPDTQAPAVATSAAGTSVAAPVAAAHQKQSGPVQGRRAPRNQLMKHIPPIEHPTKQIVMSLTVTSFSFKKYLAEKYRTALATAFDTSSVNVAFSIACVDPAAGAYSLQVKVNTDAHDADRVVNLLKDRHTLDGVATTLQVPHPSLDFSSNIKILDGRFQPFLDPLVVSPAVAVASAVAVVAAPAMGDVHSAARAQEPQVQQQESTLSSSVSESQKVRTIENWVKSNAVTVGLCAVILALVVRSAREQDHREIADEEFLPLVH